MREHERFTTSQPGKVFEQRGKSGQHTGIERIVKTGHADEKVAGADPIAAEVRLAVELLQEEWRNQTAKPGSAHRLARVIVRRALRRKELNHRKEGRLGKNEQRQMPGSCRGPFGTQRAVRVEPFTQSLHNRRALNQGETRFLLDVGGAASHRPDEPHTAQWKPDRRITGLNAAEESDLGKGNKVAMGYVFCGGPYQTVIRPQWPQRLVVPRWCRERCGQKGGGGSAASAR